MKNERILLRIGFMNTMIYYFTNISLYLLFYLFFLLVNCHSRFWLLYSFDSLESCFFRYSIQNTKIHNNILSFVNETIRNSQSHRNHHVYNIFSCGNQGFILSTCYRGNLRVSSRRFRAIKRFNGQRTRVHKMSQ